MVGTFFLSLQIKPMEPNKNTIETMSDSVAFTIVEFIIDQYVNKHTESIKIWPAEHQYILQHGPELFHKIREIIAQNYPEFTREQENLVEMHLMINQNVPNLVPIYLLIAAAYKGDPVGIWFVPRRMLFIFTRQAYDLYKIGKGILPPIENANVVLKYKFNLYRSSEKSTRHDQPVS